MLALWQYEWDESDWSGSSDSVTGTATDAFAGLLLALQWEGTTTPTTATTDTPTVGGHGRKKNDYLGQDDAFWEARARYLRMWVQPAVRKVVPVMEPPPRPTAPPIPVYQPSPLEDTITPYLLQQQALNAALQRALNARNATELLDAGRRSRALALDIAKLQQQDYERAIEILLLDVF